MENVFCSVYQKALVLYLHNFHRFFSSFGKHLSWEILVGFNESLSDIFPHILNIIARLRNLLITSAFYLLVKATWACDLLRG
jgi:hypothetical protein